MTSSSPPSAPRFNVGKLAVIAMVGVAVVAATFAWWWNWQRTQRTREFYGGEGASLVRTAPRVEGLILSGFYDAESMEQIEVGPHAFEIVGRKDLSETKGLIHARTALLDDSSYRWNDLPADCQPAIQYAVGFSRGESRITLAFDFGCREVWIVEDKKHAPMAPKIATGWKTFLDKHLQDKPLAAATD